MLNELEISSIMSSYHGLTFFDAYHLKKRLNWCPYDEISKFVPEEGLHLDIGCGYGHFLLYLAKAKPKLTLIGSDPDRRKIRIARTTVEARKGRVLFNSVPYQELDAIPDNVTSISLLDVLYLLSLDAQNRIMLWASRRLAPAGALVIKTLDPERGLRSRMAVFQEFIMVKLLQKTLSSGEFAAGQPLSQYASLLQSLGLDVQSNRLSYTRTPSVLICATKRSDAASILSFLDR